MRSTSAPQRTTPCPGEIRPTVIDKIQPIESIESRLRDRSYVVVEAVDFNIQSLYTLNLWSWDA